MFIIIFLTTLIIIIYIFSEIFSRHVHLRWIFIFFSVFHFFLFHFSKKTKVLRKCTCIKKILEKLYIMIVKVVKNTILNNFVIHYIVFSGTFLKWLSISTCVSQLDRFLKQSIKYCLLISKTESRFYTCFNF